MYSEEEKRHFDSEVSENFGFLESAGMRKGEVRASGGNDPRDRGLVVRYSREDLKIDIGWSKDDKALIISVRFDRPGLNRQERHVYFEPFLEYISGGANKAIVPFVEYGMSIPKIETVVSERRKLFEHGLKPVIEAVAQKLKANFNQLESASSNSIKSHHEWTKSKSRA